MGWASKTNGELLELAAAEFDVFLTTDRNLSYQQDISAFDIAVVVLVARSNSIEDLRPLAPRILDVIKDAGHGRGLWWVSDFSIPTHCKTFERQVTSRRCSACVIGSPL